MASCPYCGVSISFHSKAKIGYILFCPACKLELRVFSHNPAKVISSEPAEDGEDLLEKFPEAIELNSHEDIQ